MSRINRALIREAAAIASLATAEAFLGAQARESIIDAINRRQKPTGLGNFDPVQSMMRINPGYKPTIEPAKATLEPISPIPDDLFKNEAFLKAVTEKPFVTDDQQRRIIYVRTKQSMNEVPMVTDMAGYNLSEKELALYRALELAWGRMGGHRGQVAQTKKFWNYINHHAPALAKKLVANRDAAIAAKNAGVQSQISWDARSGVDWQKVAKVAALALAAYYIPLAFGAGGSGGASAATTATKAGTTAAKTAATTSKAATTAAKTASTAAKVGKTATTTAKAAKAAGTAKKIQTATTVAKGVAPKTATYAAKVASKAAVGITPNIPVASTGLTLATKAKTIIPKIVTGVNTARTVAAIAKGEVPPPPIDLKGDTFVDWAGGIAEDYLNRKLQDQISQAEREQLERDLENELRDLQRESITQLPPQPTYQPTVPLPAPVQGAQTQAAQTQDFYRLALFATVPLLIYVMADR